MIDYNTIESLQSQGMTDEDIRLFMSCKTNKDISASDLENLLSEQRLASRNPITSAWQGPLIDLMQQGNDVGEALEELFSHLNKPRSSVIATTTSPWAEKCSSLVVQLVSAQHITEEQASSIYELAGGKCLPDGVTIEQIADARAKREAFDSMMSRIADLDGLINEIKRRFIAPEYEGSQTVEEVKQSIKQSL